MGKCYSKKNVSFNTEIFSDPKANPNKMTLDLNSLLDTNETKWVTDFTG